MNAAYSMQTKPIASGSLATALGVGGLFLLAACGRASFQDASEIQDNPEDGTETAYGYTSDTATSESASTGVSTNLDQTATAPTGDIGISTGLPEEPDVIYTSLADQRVVEVSELDNTLNVFWVVRDFRVGDVDAALVCGRSDAILADNDLVKRGMDAELPRVIAYFHLKNGGTHVLIRGTSRTTALDLRSGAIVEASGARAALCVKPFNPEAMPLTDR